MVTTAKAQLQLMPAGKRAITNAMLGKGEAFVAVYILLRQHRKNEQFEYVALNCLCQGIEVLCKGLLIAYDFDTYWPKLRKKFGHDLEKLIAECDQVFNQNSLSRSCALELQQLNKFYSQHQLRYGGALDVFIAPKSLQRDKLLRRLRAMLMLLKKEQGSKS